MGKLQSRWCCSYKCAVNGFKGEGCRLKSHRSSEKIACYRSVRDYIPSLRRSYMKPVKILMSTFIMQQKISGDGANLRKSRRRYFSHFYCRLLLPFSCYPPVYPLKLCYGINNRRVSNCSIIFRSFMMIVMREKI